MYDLERLQQTKADLEFPAAVPPEAREVCLAFLDALISGHAKRGVVPTGDYSEDELVLAYVDLFIDEQARARWYRQCLEGIMGSAQTWHRERRGDEYLVQVAEMAGAALNNTEASTVVVEGSGELGKALTTIDRYQKVLNYWWPRLGYAGANEMVYPALDDERARHSPVVEIAALVEMELQGLTRRIQEIKGRA